MDETLAKNLVVIALRMAKRLLRGYDDGGKEV